MFGLITDDGILLAAYIKQKKAEASVAIIMPSSNQSPYRIAVEAMIMKRDPILGTGFETYWLLPLPHLSRVDPEKHHFVGVVFRFHLSVYSKEL